MLQKRHLSSCGAVVVVVVRGHREGPDWEPGKGTSAMGGDAPQAL
jgi:hypothetical protein